MNLKHRPSLDLATLSAVALLSATYTASAKGNTAFSDPTDPASADPLNAKYNLGINDGNDDNTGGGGAQTGESISGEGTSAAAPIGEQAGEQQQQAQAKDPAQLDAAAVGKADTDDAAGTERQAT